MLTIFIFSTNSINNYYIYRFYYFALLIARTPVFRPSFSRSHLSGCVLVTATLVCSRSAVLLSPLSSCALGCASATAVVLFSRLCFCHRRRQCSLSVVLCLCPRDLSRSPPSTVQKPVSVASQCLCKSLTQSQQSRYVSTFPYRKLIGCLLYVNACTRPAISFNNKPTYQVCQALVRLAQFV